MFGGADSLLARCLLEAAVKAPTPGPPHEATQVVPLRYGIKAWLLPGADIFAFCRVDQEVRRGLEMLASPANVSASSGEYLRLARKTWAC